jgi:hypothetical protein
MTRNERAMCVLFVFSGLCWLVISVVTLLQRRVDWWQVAIGFGFAATSWVWRGRLSEAVPGYSNRRVPDYHPTPHRQAAQ